jgi:hypothetical protein
MYKQAKTKLLQSSDLPGWRKAEESLPAPGQAVLYRTAGHQALGRYEGYNCWRCSNGEVEESPILIWQPFYLS